jgi:uncharacterized protein (TIGR00730 family)
MRTSTNKVDKESIRVTIFGGSKPCPGEPAYEEAFKLGSLLGDAGCTVLTGGYIGTMEAVSRGAALAGGDVIGVTCDEIESWRPVAPNLWVMEEIRYPTLRKRLYALIENCDIAMALPGGIGTLAEIAVMWSYLQISTSPPRPLILIGKGWEDTMQVFFDDLGEYITENDRKLLLFAKNINAAYNLFESWTLNLPT